MPAGRPPPTQERLAAARGGTVRDIIAPGLRVLFCGINPSLYSAAVGHHFARPGNRFWKALHLSGFTDRLLDPAEERALLERGVGITNIVSFATAAASELTPEDLRRGARRLEAKVRRTQPAIVAFLGLEAYRGAFDRPKAVIGTQDERVGGARIWLLPNPSGLNAHHQLPALAAGFLRLREAARVPSITSR